jgi:hypothetical protein
MKKNLTTISASEIEMLKLTREVVSVEADIDIVYEKQVPIAGLVLVQGEIEFTKKYKTLSTINSSCVVGVSEVLNEMPVQLGCKVKKDSEVIFLGRSEIINAAEEKSDLFPLVKKYLKA